MKRNIIIYTAALMLLSLASCSKITLDSHRESDIIGYNVVTTTGESAPTKAASAFPTTSSFISSAYVLTSTQNWDNDAASAAPEFGPEEVKWQATYWSTDTPHYWDASKKLTFFSYAPASLQSLGLSISREGVKVDGWDVTDANYQDKAILVADIAKDKTKNESYAGLNGVPTHFRNKLCKLTFRVAASDLVDEGTEVYLKKATLRGFYTKGNYAKGGTGAESWGNRDNQQTDYVLFESTGTDGDILTADYKDEEKIMIPQSTTGITLTIEYRTKIGTTVKDETVTLSINDDFRSGIWGMGQHITYSMKIGAGRIPILFDGSAEEWKAVDGGIIEIE